MAQRTDWMPNNRQNQITMARNWLAIFNETTQNAQGTEVKKYVAWSIPAATLNNLAICVADAMNALAANRNEETRTRVTNMQCRITFDCLVAAMRDMKKRYFYSPPLTEADIVALGLKPHDGVPTPTHAPTAQAAVEPFLEGRHQLGVKIVFTSGNPADNANKGFRIWFSLVSPGETPPSDPEELRSSFYMTRKKKVLTFNFSDSGKTAHFCVQIENEGKKGPWGPMVQALIP